MLLSATLASIVPLSTRAQAGERTRRRYSCEELWVTPTRCTRTTPSPPVDPRDPYFGNGGCTTTTTTPCCSRSPSGDTFHMIKASGSAPGCSWASDFPSPSRSGRPRGPPISCATPSASKAGPTRFDFDRGRGQGAPPRREIPDGNPELIEQPAHPPNERYGNDPVKNLRFIRPQIKLQQPSSILDYGARKSRLLEPARPLGYPARARPLRSGPSPSTPKKLAQSSTSSSMSTCSNTSRTRISTP